MSSSGVACQVAPNSKVVSWIGASVPFGTEGHVGQLAQP